MTQKLRGAQGSGAARDNQKLEAPAVRGEFIWPRPVADLRTLTREELDRLEAALEKPVDRQHLEHWASTSISNTVKLSGLSSTSQARDKLKKLASEGRKWLDQLEAEPIKGLLEQKALREHKGWPDAPPEHNNKIEELKAKMAKVCAEADSTAAALGGLIKQGGQRPTPPALTAFLDTMIGIAKWNKIRPSTPQRDMESKKPPPFFVFVEEALAIAKDVVESSPIPSEQKRRALQSLRYASRDALIKIIERSRGLIRNYHDSPYGLIEAPRQRGIRRGRNIGG
jgi:hypothetical protein